MPNDVSSGYNGARLDFADAPGADLAWDDMFPPEAPAGPPQAGPVVQPQSAPQAQPQTPSQPFLRAGDTVYETPDAAVQGTIHKDQYIARVRTFLKDNGIDPNRLERVQAQEPQAPQPTPQTPTNGFEYYGQGQKYFDALAKAASANDRAKYEEIQRAYNREAFNANMAPWGSLVAEMARQRAIRQVSAEIPDFQKFAESPEFRQAQERIPLLKELSTIGESDPNAAQRLPEVYKTIYLIYQGLNRQSVGSPAPQGPPVSTTPTVRPTPTMSQSTLTPPSPAPDTRNWTVDRDARKQLIRDGEARGINGANWGDLGL